MRNTEHAAVSDYQRGARQQGRYLQALQAQFGDELVPGLRSYHLIYSRQQVKHPHGTAKNPRHIVFYRRHDRGRQASP